MNLSNKIAGEQDKREKDSTLESEVQQRAYLDVEIQLTTKDIRARKAIVMRSLID